MRGRIPWVYAALIPLIYVIVSLAPASLFALFGTYALSAPLYLGVAQGRPRRSG